MTLKIEDIFRKYFEEQELKNKELFNNSILKICILRKDGILLHDENFNINKGFDEQSIGVLMTGLAHAGEALSSLLDNEDGLNLRLSLEDSSKGVHILPLNLESGEKFYMGTLYFNELNPGKLKNLLKNMNMELEKYITENLMAQKSHEQEENSKREDFLFSNISDAEMDELFSFAGS